MPEEKVRTFWAKSTDPAVVGLWDRHPDHPASDKYPDGGEVYVAGDAVVEVAATTLALDALAKRRIVEVSESGRPSRRDEDLPQPSEGTKAQAAVGGESPAEATRAGRR